MKKAESKTILKVYSTVESKLPTLPLEDGQLIFVYDKKKIILDNRGVRTVYEQIQTIETEEQRNDLLAPIDSFYFVIETSILWRYTNGHWNQITTSPQEQIDRIVAEGTKQVKAVRDEGQKVLQSIPEDFQTQMETKLNKQQGIENKGKVLVIGEDGNVSPGEVQSGGGDGIAIINTMSGESPLAIPDSAERVNKRLELGGKTGQVQTTGAQLFEASRYEGVTKNGVTVTVKDGVITATGTPNINTWIQVFVSRENYQKLFKPENKIYLKTNKSKDCNYDFGIYGEFGSPIIGTIREGNSGVALPAELPRNDTDFYFFIDVKIGTELKGSIKPIVYHDGDGTWEPYTGGKPSPSPEYPQEIVNAGRLNEDTGKYEIDVTINSGNLFKLIEHTSGYYVDKDGKVQINKTLGYSWTAVVNNLQKQRVTLHVTTMINIRYRLYCTDLQNTILYKYEDSSSNTNDNSHTFNMPDGAKKIYVSVIEINSVEQAEITLNLGNVTLPYEPYTEQTLTITSDRPITKWDRLVEQGREIGWLYGGKIIESYNSEQIDTEYISNTGKLSVGATVLYKLKETEFVQLQQTEQNAIRALKTYYPTTVITADGGELDPDIKATYTADTKNYIDNKFGKTINAMQTKLLELESRV